MSNRGRGATEKLTASITVQLLPHADHIVVLDEDGRIAQRGSFNNLDSLDGYVGALGLKKATVKEIEAVLVEEEEHERLEKDVAVEKTVLVQEAKAEAEEKKPSRGKRNSDALFSYVKSMGKFNFPIFCAFTVCNIGFRSAQRESPFCFFRPPCSHPCLFSPVADLTKPFY